MDGINSKSGSCAPRQETADTETKNRDTTEKTKSITTLFYPLERLVTSNRFATRVSARLHFFSGVSCDVSVSMEGTLQRAHRHFLFPI